MADRWPPWLERSLRRYGPGFPVPIMFAWAVLTLLIAIAAALYGFGGWDGAWTLFARGTFIAGLVLFLVLLVIGWPPPRR